MKCNDQLPLLLFAELGKHKFSKTCLYVRKLSDADFDIHTKLVKGANTERKNRHYGWHYCNLTFIPIDNTDTIANA